MSWITDLADKAENILNKIDQNAATALQIPTPCDSNESPNKPKNNQIGTTISENFRIGLSDSIEFTEQKDNSQIISSRRNSNANELPVVIEMDSNGHQISTDSNMCYKAKKSSPLINDEVTAFKIAFGELSTGKDELCMSLPELNGHIENVNPKQRSQELEMLVLRLTKERDQAYKILLDSQNSNNAYVHSIFELETNLAKVQQEYLEIADKLQMQIKETEQQHKEMQEYRSKAQRALQLKDNVIAEFKSNSKGSELGVSVLNVSEFRLLQMQHDSLKYEHQQTLEEQRKLHFQLEESQRDIDTLNKQYTEQLSVLQRNEDFNCKELRLERERLLISESEQRLLLQELNTIKQKLNSHIASATATIQEKDKRLLQLELKQRTLDISQCNEIDDIGRIKTLTERLVDKQNEVEKVTAERNALRIQLEKIQDQLKQNLYQKNSSNIGPIPKNVLLSNSTDDVKAQFPILMKVNPFDNRVARRVKRAYSSLDSAGIRLGVFLRRYPLMRIFVLMYIALLHLWVMFVLLSSTPN